MIKITSNVDKVLKQVRQYRDELQNKMRLFLEKLGGIGVNTANVRFSTARYDGDNDVIVDFQWLDENKLVVSATGKAVTFIEFGSGIMADFTDYAMQYGYGPGSWSDNEALGGKHHWQDLNGWYYEHGKKTIGNPPARAMYDAGKEMRNRIAEIAREVWKK